MKLLTFPLTIWQTVFFSVHLHIHLEDIHIYKKKRQCEQFALKPVTNFVTLHNSALSSHEPNQMHKLLKFIFELNASFSSNELSLAALITASESIQPI